MHPFENIPSVAAQNLDVAAFLAYVTQIGRTYATATDIRDLLDDYTGAAMSAHDLDVITEITSSKLLNRRLASSRAALVAEWRAAAAKGGPDAKELTFLANEMHGRMAAGIASRVEAAINDKDLDTLLELRDELVNLEANAFTKEEKLALRELAHDCLDAFQANRKI